LVSCCELGSGAVSIRPERLLYRHVGRKSPGSTRPWNFFRGAAPASVIDNDGVDDSSGETLFLRLGKIEAMN
jgi:hypothetical protein